MKTAREAIELLEASGYRYVIIKGWRTPTGPLYAVRVFTPTGSGDDMPISQGTGDDLLVEVKACLAGALLVTGGAGHA